jgi:copper(I)-binding protein
MKDGVMIMRPVEGGLEIPAGEMVELKPGGVHIMFMAVSDPFDEGESVPVTLEFEKAGSVELNLPVGPRGGGAPDDSGH